MSDIEKELEKEVKACKETPEGNIERRVARIYDILRELPFQIRAGLQCFIYDIPLTKPIKKTYSEHIHDNDN